MLRKLLLAVLVASPALAVAYAPAAPRVIHALPAWEFACKLTQADCDHIPKPKIVARHLFGPYGAFGAFTLEEPDSILVDDQIGPFLDTVVIEATLAHEVTHYLDYVTHGEEWMKANICVSEMHGWRVGNAWLITHGRADLADFNWQQRYGCFGAGVSDDE